MIRLILLITSLSLLGTATCRADENPPKSNPDPFASIADGFQFMVQDTKAPKLVRVDKPLLSYTNPVRGFGQSGSVYLWTHQERPAVIGSLWTNRGKEGGPRRLFVELHSLRSDSVEATLPELPQARRSMPNWSPPSPAVQWKPFGDPIKNRSAVLLRTFLRRSATEFSATLTPRDAETKESLRLLTSPLYQYQTNDIVAGGVFAFTLATDPEAFLLIEARKESGRIQLYHACARLTGRPLEMKHKDQTVWSVEQAQVWSGTSAYLFCPFAATVDF